MQIRVGIGGWEHECCGDAYEVDEIVTWDLFLPDRGRVKGGATYFETHHDLLSGGLSVAGCVVAIELVSESHENIASLTTGVVLESEYNEFVMTLEIAERTELPRTRA
jgi:hypothetical protein